MARCVPLPSSFGVKVDDLDLSRHAVSGSSIGIDGMPDDEGRALLNAPKAHALQPRYRLAVSCGVDDVVTRDDLSMLHPATPTDPADPRTPWRITVKPAGDAPV